jgi:hypothetical protein
LFTNLREKNVFSDHNEIKLKRQQENPQITENDGRLKEILPNFHFPFNFFLFTYSYEHTLLGPFLPHAPCPPPYPSSPHAPRFRAEPVLPSVSNFVEEKM